MRKLLAGFIVVSHVVLMSAVLLAQNARLKIVQDTALAGKQVDLYAGGILLENDLSSEKGTGFYTVQADSPIEIKISAANSLRTNGAIQTFKLQLKPERRYIARVGSVLGTKQVSQPQNANIPMTILVQELAFNTAFELAGDDDDSGTTGDDDDSGTTGDDDDSGTTGDDDDSGTTGDDDDSGTTGDDDDSGTAGDDDDSGTTGDDDDSGTTGDDDDSGTTGDDDGGTTSDDDGGTTSDDDGGTTSGDDGGTTSGGDDGATSVRAEESGTPKIFQLQQNYPNPFNPSTTIRFSLPATEQVTLKIYDLQGRLVAELLNEKMGSGNYQLLYNAANLSTGTYFYSLTYGKSVETKRMLLIK